MEQPRLVEQDTDPAQMVHPTMPNHASTEAEFLALVEQGVADVEAGRTVPFEAVADRLRRRMYHRA